MKNLIRAIFMRHKLLLSTCFSAFIAIQSTPLFAYDAELNALLLESSNLMQEGRVEEALVLLRGAETRYSESREFMNNLAVAYLGDSQPDIALSILRQLVENDPMYSIITHNLMEMELQISDNRSDKIKPVLFIQTVESFFDDELGDLEPRNTNPIPEEEILPAISSPGSSSTLPQNTSLLAEDLVTLWARRWSAKDYSGYISLYSTGFRGPAGETYSEWASLRRSRLNKPGPILVRIANTRVEQISEDEMHVTFDQSYSSENYSDQVRKQLILIREDSDWKISRETTLAVY